MFTTTPQEIHDGVLRLRDKIGLQTEPVFVPVAETSGHQLNECFFNVMKHVRSKGGSVQHGWTVWEAEGRFIEAEFHAVWVAPDGKFIDVTPHLDGETTIVFIPDPVRIYKNRSPNNVRLALSNDPEVVRFVEDGKLADEFRKAYVADNPLYRANRNDPCPCGSGLKYKKCHGAPGS